MLEVKNLIIIGGGPAGLTAALYASRANLKPLIIEGRSQEAGGQLMWTTNIENFPGFESISGFDIIGKMRKHAEKFGSEFLTEDVTEVDFKKRPFTVKIGKKIYKSKTIIITTGAKPKMLGLKSEQQFMGTGVSTCATCDGAFFNGKEVVVVGGGDSALEEALFLTKFATKVTVIHRRDQLKASKIMQDRAFSNKKINFIWDTAIEDILDVNQKKVTGIKLKNLKTGKVSELKTNGVFVAIGHTPNTNLFKGQIEIDEKGYIVTNGVKTNVPGIFAAGDVQDHVYRQAITSAGTGCMAAIDAERFLEAEE